MTNSPNLGATASDYARHRAGFPDSLFSRLATFGIGTSGQSIVDLGTGTGTLARGFARRGCRVVGVDVEERLLEQARELDAAASVAVEYRVARAEATRLPEGCANIVTAGQCWRRGRIRASTGVGSTLPEPEVHAFDQELATMLARPFPQDVRDVPHRVFALVGRAPGSIGSPSLSLEPNHVPGS